MLIVLIAAALTGCTSPLDLLPTATATPMSPTVGAPTALPTATSQPAQALTATPTKKVIPTATRRSIPTLPLLLKTATPTQTRQVTATLTPTITRTPTATPDPRDCNKAEFVADVTYPDGAAVDLGQRFTKIWRFRNVGFCTWDSSYSIAFFDGTQMNGPRLQPLNITVKPGQTAEVSIDLVAPGMPGEYKGAWKLMAPGGELFSSDPSGFWVVIQTQVQTPSPTPMPDWRSLRLGDSGVEVLAAQYLIKMYGPFVYTNGNYSEQTANAVSSYQRSIGLPADGVIGNDTWIAMTGKLVLREGNDSGAVLALQNLLQKKGEVPLWISGIYDKATIEAVKAYQQANQMEQTGTTSLELWQMLITK